MRPKELLYEFNTYLFRLRVEAVFRYSENVCFLLLTGMFTKHQTDSKKGREVRKKKKVYE